jgi:hypothetical protein
MSQLKLSDNLINEIQSDIVSVDDRAKDPYVMLQYLAAIQGYVVGRQQIETPEKHQIQEELNAFTKHVLEDVVSSMRQHSQQARGEALGIWRPEDG